MKSAGVSYPLILIGIFGLVLVVVAGVVLLQNNETAVQPGIQESGESTQMQETAEEVAISANDCEGITDLQEQITCYSDIAVEQNDHSICLELEGQRLHDGCLLVFGAKTNKLYPCALMKTTEAIEKELCVGTLITIATDVEEACKQLTDTSTMRDQCTLAQAPNGNPENCQDLEAELWRDNCYINKAETAGDVSWCEQVSGSFLKDNCYLDLAEQLNDYSLCSNIESQLIRYGFCAPR